MVLLPVLTLSPTFVFLTIICPDIGAVIVYLSTFSLTESTFSSASLRLFSAVFNEFSALFTASLKVSEVMVNRAVPADTYCPSWTSTSFTLT